MKTTITVVPIKTIALKITSSSPYQHSNPHSKQKIRQTKSTHHVRNTMIKNKNVYFLSKRWEKQVSQKIHNSHPDLPTECRHSRKGSYTPDIFRNQKGKNDIEYQKPKTARHLSKSEVLEKKEKSSNPFPEKKPLLQLFPRRKLYHNKYYNTSVKETNKNKKVSSSCNHQQFMEHVLELQLPNPEVYLREPSSPQKERSMAYKRWGHEISPWKISKEEHFDFQ